MTSRRNILRGIAGIIASPFVAKALPKVEEELPAPAAIEGADQVSVYECTDDLRGIYDVQFFKPSGPMLAGDLVYIGRDGKIASCNAFAPPDAQPIGRVLEVAPYGEFGLPVQMFSETGWFRGARS